MTLSSLKYNEIEEVYEACFYEIKPNVPEDYEEELTE